MSDNMIIHIEFNEEQHNFLSSKDYVLLTENLLSLSKEIAKILGIKDEIELLVLPPETGSLKTAYKISKIVFKGAKSTVIGIIVLTAGFANFIDTEFGKAFLMKTTGKTPAELAFALGEGVNVILEKIVTGFLNLQAINVPVSMDETINISNMIKSKNNIYTMFTSIKNIKHISYISNGSETAPILYKDFNKYIAPNYKEEITEEMDLTIYKSVNVDINEAWKFMKDDGLKFNSKIKDTIFLKKFFNGEYPLKKSPKPDIINARVKFSRETINDSNYDTNFQILKVNSFNSTKITRTIMKPFSIEDFTNEQ